jgi:multicomponent Na+:H+ antiporter subunit G
MIDLLASLLVLLGAIFILLASIGLYRMPDSYARLQVGTKASTLGLLLIFSGMVIYHPDWIWKMIVLFYFILLTNPLSSHALARVAHQSNVKQSESTVVDQLSEDNLTEREQT